MKTATISHKAVRVMSARPGNTNLQVQSYNKQPLKCYVGNYKPSKKYRKTVQYLKSLSEITNREQIKFSKDYHKMFVQEVMVPKLVFALIDYCKTEWSLRIRKRKAATPEFYRLLTQAINHGNAKIAARRADSARVVHC